MSASREKKLRKDSVITKNTQDMRSQQDAKKDRRFYIMCIVIVVVLAIAFAVCYLYSNDNIRKNMTAVTVDGTKYSAAELDYYYYSMINQASSYLSYFGVDVNQDLDAQQYTEDQSWGDYFRQEAVTSLTQTVTFYNEAIANGFALSEEAQSELDEYFTSIDTYCESAGITRDQYLQSSYGDYMTDEIFTKHLTMSYIASQYSSDYQANHVFSDDEINAYYEENKQNIDLASYEVLTVNADYTDVEGVTEETTEYTDAQTSQAMEAAKNTANAFLDRVDSGEALADIAAEFGEENYSTHEDVSYSSFTSYAFNDWVFDEERTIGEASVVEDETKNCWYVVVLNNRERPEYNTVDVRHILIAPEENELEEDDEGYEAEDTRLNEEAQQKAQAILDEYLAGEQTEDAFAALAVENSSDSNASDGGLYTQIYKGEMLDAFENWCFDESRQTGDTGIVETTYGYHVMYYVGEDIPYWQVRCINNLLTQWQDDIVNNAQVTQHKLGIKAIG